MLGMDPLVLRSVFLDLLVFRVHWWCKMHHQHSTDDAKCIMNSLPPVYMPPGGYRCYRLFFCLQVANLKMSYCYLLQILLPLSDRKFLQGWTAPLRKTMFNSSRRWHLMMCLKCLSALQPNKGYWRLTISQKLHSHVCHHHPASLPPFLVNLEWK